MAIDFDKLSESMDRSRRAAAIRVGASAGAIAITVGGLRQAYAMLSEAEAETAQAHLHDLKKDLAELGRQLDALRNRVLERGILLLEGGKAEP